jgi:hypothetical protein
MLDSGMLPGLREIAGFEPAQLLAVAVVAIVALVACLLAALGLSAWLWHALTLARLSFQDLRAVYKQKMNLHAVEVLARRDEQRKSRMFRLSRGPSSLRDPLPPESRGTPLPPRRETPIPDTLPSLGVAEVMESVAETPRPPPLPDGPLDSVHSVQLHEIEPPSAGLDWRDSRLHTTELHPETLELQRQASRPFPLVKDKRTKVWPWKK